MEKENPSLIVLMADDDEDDCLLVESAFKETDLVHELRFVGDGRELLDYLYNEGDFSDLEKYPRPNLILLDLNMPRIDGREALAIIKSDPRLQEYPHTYPHHIQGGAGHSLGRGGRGLLRSWQNLRPLRIWLICSRSSAQQSCIIRIFPSR